MASTTLPFLLIFFSLIFVSESRARAPYKPNGLILPVQKDAATGLHVTNIRKRSPLLTVPFLVYLNGQLLWLNCDKHYLSSTYNTPFCRSTQCSRVGNHQCRQCSTRAGPGCHNNACGVLTTNPITRRTTMGELGQDVLSFQSINRGSNIGPVVTVPQFLFSCAPSSLLQGPLPKNVQGVAGLGNGPIALPNQLASHFGFSPKFAICLPSTTKGNGVIFFGDGSYNMRTGMDISRSLVYTPLTISPQGEYYIQVSAIKISGKAVPLNTALLTKNKQGFGGVMISTIAPYTVLERSIYTGVSNFFAKQLSNVPQVKAVLPFGLCFDANKMPRSQAGYGVPNIDLILQNQNIVWSITGANSIVTTRPGVACLAFVDGGANPKATITIGAFQLEDNLIQFDLTRSTLGFSSSLLTRHTNCANFNFSSNP